MLLLNHCLFRFRVFKCSVFDLSADWGTILCVPSFCFKTWYTSDVCIGLYWKKSVTLLLSQYYFHWAFAVSERKIYTWLSAHSFHSCLLWVQGGGLWHIFGVGSFLRNRVTFRVVLYRDRTGASWSICICAYNQISTISYFTRSYYQLL